MPARASASAKSASKTSPRPYETLPPLINRVMERVVAVGNKDYQAFGLNVRGARVMLALADGEALRVFEIIARCGIEPSTFSHLLTRLAKLGYVTRQRPEEDNRAVLVRLTARGRQVARQCRVLVDRHHHLIADRLSAGEVESLRKLMLKLHKGPGQPE